MDNSTAKNIAEYFIKTTSNNISTKLINKSTYQAKTLLSKGYTEEEIFDAIDFVNNKGIKLYSLGYIVIGIDGILDEIEDLKQEIKIKEEVKLMEKELASTISQEVKKDDATNRNKKRISRFGIQSRFRTKHNLNMFKGQ